MELELKPDFEQAMKRVEAWFAHDMIDRPPVRFSEHNAEFSVPHEQAGRRWPDLKARWFDAEYQVDYAVAHMRRRKFLGETFPIFWPNLGPNVYAAFHGAELDFGEVTSWVEHCVHDWEDAARLRFSPDNAYYRKIEEMTRMALQKAGQEFMVGYTDLHGSLDCVADWRDPQNLCLDLLDCPDQVKALTRLADENFLTLFDRFDQILKHAGQLSVTWMGIPSRGKMHIPSCDFCAMTSHEAFQEFYQPSLEAEIRHMDHNIFHLDGKGMLRHLDLLLTLPEIQGIQWVQGAGDDLPILQWLPVIRKIQAAGKGVVVDVPLGELEAFMAQMSPQGLYLCLSAPEADQPDILKRLENWTGGKG